jgi:GSCFA family
VTRSGLSRWSSPDRSTTFASTAHGRLNDGFTLVRVEPKFRLREEDVFFCIGSCFARNIEDHLIYRDLKVTSNAFPSRRSEWHGRPSGLANKFTTASMLNELRWAFGEAEFRTDSLMEDPDGWRDLQLTPGSALVTRDRALERRRDLAAYFRRIRDASVVIITLGLVEAWYDRTSGIFLNAAPTMWATRREPGRFTLTVTNYTDNLAQLDDIVALLGRHGAADLRIVITVSPVPMGETFTGGDVIAANLYSKSTLRAVAEDAARKYDCVQYFPSYDTMVTSPRRSSYSSVDELHVLDTAVQAVTSHFLSTFGIDRERPHPEFDEVEYLQANPDVHDAVADGRFASGYDHWRAAGRNESRPLRRTENRPIFLEHRLR